MSHSSNVWANPFSDADREDFIDYVEEKLTDGAEVEDVTMRWSFLVGAADRGSPDQFKIFDVTSLAADRDTAGTATDDQGIAVTGKPAWITSRTQDPVTGGDAKTTPRSQLICLGGLGVVVQMGLIVAPATVAIGNDLTGQATAAAIADETLAGIHAAFEASVLEVLDGRVRRCEVLGLECVSYGASRVGVYGPPTLTTTVDDVSTATRFLYSGQVTAKERGWRKIKPTVIGADSQLSILLNVPRATDWPIRPDTRFRVDVLAPALIGRLAIGGKNCDRYGQAKK